MDHEEKRTSNRRTTDVCDCPTKTEVELILIEVKTLKEAFPEGPQKHREEHEAWMAAKKAEKDFYDSMKMEIMKKGVAGVFALIVIILGLAVTGLGHNLVEHTLGK